MIPLIGRRVIAVPNQDGSVRSCVVNYRDYPCDDARWDEIDDRGIYLGRVCERCRDAKIRKAGDV